MVRLQNASALCPRRCSALLRIGVSGVAVIGRSAKRYLGFLSTRMTESPRRKSFVMKRSLCTGFAFFCPFPVRGTYAGA